MEMSKCKNCDKPTPKPILEKFNGLCITCETMRNKHIKFF